MALVGLSAAARLFVAGSIICVVANFGVVQGARSSLREAESMGGRSARGSGRNPGVAEGVQEALRCNPGMFSCPKSQRCVPNAWRCDGDADCPEGEDEKDCDKLEFSCSPGEFLCGDKVRKCIPSRWQCDGDKDCDDGSDENPSNCASRNCSEDQFLCPGTKFCIPSNWRCDGQKDCSNGLDETNCAPASCDTNEFKCDNGHCIFSRWRCDLDDDCGDQSDEVNCTRTCSPSQFACKDGRCITDRWLCDGEVDCLHGEDEHNCSSTKKPARSCREFEWTCGDGSCILNRWKCDQEADCPDGSDEAGCGAIGCSHDEFRCRDNSGKCLAMSQRCDKKRDCDDGSDEHECPTPKPCNQTKEFDCGAGVCIPLEKACDAKQDCQDGRDEEVALCKEVRHCDDGKNGGCQDLCVSAGRRALCECKHGYVLVNKTHCADVDECQAHTSPCSQVCVNTAGSFKCKCSSGYLLQPDGTTCRAMGDHPTLLLSNRAFIRQIDLVTKRFQPLITDLQSAVAMDYVYANRTVIWSDVSTERIRICTLNSSSLPGSLSAPASSASAAGCGRDLVSRDIATPDGMAVDWVHGLLYWTDTGLDKISVIDLDGKFRKTLFHEDLEEPRAIAVDPHHARLFWTDWGKKPKIESAWMDGTHRATLVEDSELVAWPNGLAVDLPSQRVFWTDAKLRVIYSMNYEGKDMKQVLSDASTLRHPFSLTVFEEKVYWTDWDTEGVHAANKLNGGGNEVVVHGIQGPMTIKVFHPMTQPKLPNKCENHDCEHLCLPRPAEHGTQAPFSCACQDGSTLHEDKKKCISPSPRKTTLPPGGDGPTSVSGGGGGGGGGAGVSGASGEPPTTLRPSLAESTPGPHESLHARTEGSGSSAVVVLGVLAVAIAILAVLGWMVYKRWQRGALRIPSFAVPLYRKAADEADDRLRLAFHEETEYHQPNAVYQPTTTLLQQEA